MSRQHFPLVWYASETKFNTSKKLVVFEDKGPLSFSTEKITFEGMKNTGILDKKTITNISLTHRKINWVVILISNCALFAWLRLLRFSTIHAVTLLAVSFAVSLLVAFTHKWVCVEHKNSSGELEKVYFADGSGLGWHGVLGGTAKLYKALTMELGPYILSTVH